MDELKNYIKIKEFMGEDDYRECLKIFKNIDNAKEKILNENNEEYQNQLEKYFRNLNNYYVHPLKKGAC